MPFEEKSAIEILAAESGWDDKKKSQFIQFLASRGVNQINGDYDVEALLTDFENEKEGLSN